MFGALLPFLVVIGIPAAALWFLWRRRRTPPRVALAGGSSGPEADLTSLLTATVSPTSTAPTAQEEPDKP
uniref:hypothetical protein n=1 Tax=Fodinicola feengrottensis TaxID=435914 RepID=UPI0036F37E43